MSIKENFVSCAIMSAPNKSMKELFEEFCEKNNIPINDRGEVASDDPCEEYVNLLCVGPCLIVTPASHDSGCSLGVTLGR